MRLDGFGAGPHAAGIKKRIRAFVVFFERKPVPSVFRQSRGMEDRTRRSRFPGFVRARVNGSDFDFAKWSARSLVGHALCFIVPFRLVWRKYPCRPKESALPEKLTHAELKFGVPSGAPRPPCLSASTQPKVCQSEDRKRPHKEGEKQSAQRGVEHFQWNGSRHVPRD